MSARYIRRTSSLDPGPAGLPNANSIRVDSDDNLVKVGTGSSGTTENTLVDTSSSQTLTGKTLTAPVIVEPFATIVGDGAIPITSGTTYLTKGSAAAITVAAPGAAGIGVILKITTGSDFAHVVSFTGSTLHDGTTGGHAAWTAAAFQGSSLTVVGVTATKWNVLAMNLGAIV